MGVVMRQVAVLPRTLHFASTARKLAGHLCREVDRERILVSIVCPSLSPEDPETLTSLVF